MKNMRKFYENWIVLDSNKVYLTAIMSSALSIFITLLVCYDSKYIWAHRAFIASEAKHDDYPDAEYSKTFIDMKGSKEARKHDVNIKNEQRALILCYHPSTNQWIHYIVRTTEEGTITKVEQELTKDSKRVGWKEIQPLKPETEEETDAT